MTAREALLRAAELIVERGHSRGSYENSTGGLCAAGAIHVALGMHPNADDQDGRWNQLTAAKEPLRALVGVTLSTWNDSSTAGEVIAALRAAAAFAERPEDWPTIRRAPQAQP